MEWDLKRLDMIVHQLEIRKGTYTVDDIVASFQSNTEGQSFFNFMQGIIARLKQIGKIRTVSYTHLDVYKRQVINNIHLYRRLQDTK